MRRIAVTMMACAFLAGAVLPASAATATVSVVDFAFSPKAIKIKQGDTVKWTNTGTRPHTATQDAPLSLFTTGNIASGMTSAGKVLTAAGVYPYHCTIHPSMTGSIKVPVKVAPLSGTTATVFTVTVATQAAPSGFVYDVQEMAGSSGTWTAYRTGVMTSSVTFTAASPGTYSFRSILRKTSTGAKSKPSPAKAVTVT
jgi:plastocyanin